MKLQVLPVGPIQANCYLLCDEETKKCAVIDPGGEGANSEMQDKKWLWGGIAFQLGTGYMVAFLVYQIGTLITTGSLGAGFVPGLIAVLVMVAIVIFLIQRTEKKMKAEYTLKNSVA